MDEKKVLPLKCIRLDYGADDPLLLEVDDDALAADCRGPEGVVGEAAAELVAGALTAPAAGPPLESHVVPGDRVAIGLSGDVPQAAAIIKAISQRLVAAGIEPADIALLQAPPLDGTASPLEGASAGVVATEFDPTVEPQTSYMAADEAGRAIYSCPFSGVIHVAVDGQSWSRAWWSASGDTVVEWLPAARVAVPDSPEVMDGQFDRDHAAWVISERARLAAAAAAAASGDGG